MFPEELLQTYMRAFQKLKQGGTKYGKAPHKPVFLITLIELIEKRLITVNQIQVTPELVATFKENFALLVTAAHKDDFTQPFFYLQSDGFWFLNPKAGATIDAHIKSTQTLSDRLAYACFAEDLFQLLLAESTRFQLKQTLLDQYFVDTRSRFLKMKGSGTSYFDKLEMEVLNEKAVPYVSPQPADDEETRFIRSGLFKRLVPKVYDFTCAVSGMKVIAVDGSSLVEACHIVPISLSGDDKVTNGIALSPTLHTAFDRGMITIDEQLRVVISALLADNTASPYNLTQFHGQTLRLPFGSVHYPKQEHFAWHRARVFKG